MSNVESTRSKVKNRSGHSFTELVGRWVRGSLFLRDNCVHSNQESMDSERVLRAGTTLTCFYFDTQKTIWMPCAESTVQDKRSPDVRTRDPLTKSKLREKSRENSRRFGKQACFPQQPKLSERQTFLCRLFQENGVALSQYLEQLRQACWL